MSEQGEPKNGPTGADLTAGLFELVRRYGDVLLPIAVIVIIGVIIVPLPLFLLDLLLATNLTLAITLLMLSLYVPNALSLASFSEHPADHHAVPAVVERLFDAADPARRQGGSGDSGVR